MKAAVKLSQRVSTRFILKKLCYYSNRSLRTFSKLHEFHFYPSSSILRLNNSNHICSNICGCLLRGNTSNYRSMSTSQDKDDEAESDTNEKDQESTEEEIETDEGESDGDQNEQIIDLQNKVEELQSELKKYQDALARSHADIINIQNMSKKDVEAAKKFATKNFSRDMLNVADSLQSCIAVVEQYLDDYKTTTKDDETDENIKSVIDGVKLTHNALLDTFGRHGISKIESLHKEFDPNYHEALFKMPCDEHPPDHVVQVISEGYTIKDTVLRAAKVGVSTPSPQVQQTKSNGNNDNKDDNDNNDNDNNDNNNDNK